MTITFTDEELRHIEKEPFNWHPTKTCPDDLRESINQKLRILKEHAERLKGGSQWRTTR